MARGRKPIGHQAMTAAERQRRRRTSETYRRAKPVDITWSSDGARIGRITIGGEYWGAVEWSEKRQAWCIEDAEGRCLAHPESVHGRAPTKDEAVALAIAMIRDGRLPSPEAARAAVPARNAGRAERRAKRQAQPAEQRKRAERQERREELSRLMTAEYELRWKDEQVPLWEALHEVFDLTDSELWKSNSFAALRPRLILHLQADVARLEHELARHRDNALTQPFAMWANTEQRRQLAERPRTSEERQAAAVELKLARAREVLTAMEAA